MINPMLPDADRYSVGFMPPAAFTLDLINKKIPEIRACNMSRAELFICIATIIKGRWDKLPKELKEEFEGQLPEAQKNIIHFSNEANCIKEILPTKVAVELSFRSQQDLLVKAMRSTLVSAIPEYEKFMDIFEISVRDIVEQWKLLSGKENNNSNSNDKK